MDSVENIQHNLKYVIGLEYVCHDMCPSRTLCTQPLKIFLMR